MIYAHALLALAEAAAATPVGYGMALAKMFAALVLVCVLAFVILRYGVRKLTALPGYGDGIKVQDRRGLGAGKAVWIVEVDQRRFLLGTAEKTIAVLAELQPATPVDRDTAPTATERREGEEAGQ